MIHLDVPYTGVVALSDFVYALVLAGLPEDCTVTLPLFHGLLLRAHNENVRRDDRGVYVELVRCRIRLEVENLDGR